MLGSGVVDGEDVRVGEQGLHACVPYRCRVEVITPRTLDEALRVKSERPDARPIAGGTDLLVELNFDRTRPETILNLAEVPELKGWGRENGSLRLGAGLTYTEAMKPELAELLPALAEASRTVGSPQIRNRGTIGGNLGTASPAGDAHPPLLVEDAIVEIGERSRRAHAAADRVLPRPEAERARGGRAGRSRSGSIRAGSRRPS